MEVPGLFPDTGGAFSPARLALAAASDLELIFLIIIPKLFLYYLRTICKKIIFIQIYKFFKFNNTLNY
jgi:hypothetical protein